MSTNHGAAMTLALLPETIESGDIVIRRWATTDAAAMTELITTNLEHLRPWMAWALREPLTIEERLRLFRRWDQYWASRRGAVYALEAGQDLVGGCALHRRLGPGGIDLGYWLTQRATGRGIATRAAAALTAAAFTLDDVDFVQISHTRANTHSGSVAERLGFTKLVPSPGPEVTTWQRQRHQ